MDLVDSLSRACVTALPDATVILHGSLALGDFRPGRSDIDLLVISDLPTEGLVAAVERVWRQDPTNLDLRVVTYAAAARPTKTPHMTLYVSLTDEHGLYVEQNRDEPDLVIEFSVCRQLGHTDVIGPVPDEWVDEVGVAVAERWKEIGYDPPHQELMALTACRMWRFREERVHSSKAAAAAWARARGARVAFDEESVRALLEHASPSHRSER
ncbi:MAG TPA: nucleotidyltransferase domain-containing protein [Gaiellaceae bacterium]|jgi:hypothetical protein|nr:nucleotidyltransferase domain-containing protein [Gaiellaceae bacterium]